MDCDFFGTQSLSDDLPDLMLTATQVRSMFCCTHSREPLQKIRINVLATSGLYPNRVNQGRYSRALENKPGATGTQRLTQVAPIIIGTKDRHLDVGKHPADALPKLHSTQSGYADIGNKKINVARAELHERVQSIGCRTHNAEIGLGTKGDRAIRAATSGGAGPRRVVLG